MEKFDQVVSVWGPNPLCERGYGFQINSNETGSKLVYGSEKNLVLRDYDNPENCTVYSDHRGEVTVAKFSHKGDYIASADKLGSIHLLKVKGDQLEFEKTFMGIGGRVYDLCWYPNDKGLAVGGDAKGTNGRVFTLSGTDQGAIQAPKRLTSVDMSPVGQVTKGHLVTGSDDNRARTYHYDGGFKSSEVSIPHENACNMVRFSPNGELIASVGGKMLLVNKVSDGYSLLKQMKDHNGTVYGCGWNTEGTRILTCSADKTVKLWDVETGKCLSSFDMKGTSGYVKNDAVDFQVGCCFAGDRPVSLSLSGDINYLDDSTGKIGRIVRGPAGSLTGVSVHKDGLAGVSTQGEILLYSSEGHVSRAKGLTEPKTGVGCVSVGDILYSTSFDDRVSEVKVSGEELALSNGGFNLEHQPVYIRKCGGDTTGQFIVATTSEVYILKDVKKPNGTLRLPTGCVATCACLSPDGTILAVGLKSNEVKFYFVSNGGTTITDSGQSFGKFPHEPISMSFSPKGDQCAIGLKTKFVKVCSVLKSGNSLKIVDFCTDNWCRNSSSIFDVDYSPDGTKLLSCGGEGGIVVYNALDGDSFDPLYHFKLAHKSGVIQTKWIDDNSFYSVGRFDGTVKKWKVA